MDSDSSEPTKGLTIGFLGCGTIASAIATGLLTANTAPSTFVHIENVVVTRRSEQKSTDLQRRFPGRVRIADSNQDVVNTADVIFLTVLPSQTTQVLQELKFDASRHTLVSLVSTSNLESLRTDSNLPEESVYKMICLPAVAYNEGVCLLQSPQGEAVNRSNQRHADLMSLLDSLGSVVPATDDRQMSAMMVPSGLMGTLYGMLRDNRNWLMQNAAMSSHDASYLVTRYFHGMMQDAVREINLDQLIADQTPGGLNEQALANAESLGITSIHDKIQDAMFRRILGESDGSL